MRNCLTQLGMSEAHRADVKTQVRADVSALSLNVLEQQAGHSGSAFRMQS